MNNRHRRVARLKKQELNAAKKKFENEYGISAENAAEIVKSVSNFISEVTTAAGYIFQELGKVFYELGKALSNQLSQKGGVNLKLKDGYYKSSEGVGGLILDLPTKNPKSKKKPKIKVGDMVQCEAEEFIYPFRGYVEQVLNHSAIIRIENTMKCDAYKAKEKGHIAVARIKDIEVMK